MNAYQKKQTYEKCCNIIVSCKTRDQLNVAKNYINLFDKIIGSRYIKMLLNDLIQQHSLYCV